MSITSKQLRQKYLDFFESKGHRIIPSASLIPENDPTVLFTTAGMHPLVPYLLGEKHPAGTRLTNAQKCVRTIDIDEVGDSGHLTFFEMLGNWSLGDYFKKETIEWSWEFLTSPKWLGLDPKKLAVSVFVGDKIASADKESASIWQSLGVPENRIAYLPRANNWWGPAGQTGPCGPDTEMFYWHPSAGSGQEESEFPPENSNPATDEENWLEIWNDVFLQYNKVEVQNFASLQHKNVDTGMGLERTLVILNNYVDVFQTDTLWPIIQKIEEISGHEYIENKDVKRAMRIIADHLRTATMIMGDERGVAPSNTDQGYIVRRMIRRAVRFGQQIGIKEHFCSAIAEEVIKIFADVYPEVEKNREFVINEMGKEESKFRNTVEQGLKEFTKLTRKMTVKEISGKEAFKLYDTYGFPLEMTQELAQENNLTVDANGFNEAFLKHQELSRAGAEQKFKGGLADTGEMSTKYHTATHLLHAALRQVLGEHVAQRGSNITAERLRFDFNHPQKMTPEEIEKVEKIVNDVIQSDLPVSCEEMNFDEAKALGAIGLFSDKYGVKVKVYTIGNNNNEVFSREICGGPHAARAGILGKFKIIKEEAVSAGVRRIKAVCE